MTRVNFSLRRYAVNNAHHNWFACQHLLISMKQQVQLWLMRMSMDNVLDKSDLVKVLDEKTELIWVHPLGTLNRCTRFHRNITVVETIHSKLKCVWIPKVIRIDCLGNITFQGNLSDRSWDFSIWTKVVSLPSLEPRHGNETVSPSTQDNPQHTAVSMGTISSAESIQ